MPMWGGGERDPAVDWVQEEEHSIEMQLPFVAHIFAE